MPKIKVERPAPQKLQELGVSRWPVWEKEVSRFDWYYDTQEVCYFLEGKVVVEEEGGEKVEMGKGDLVTFPPGLECVWDIKKAVEKHYNFG
ncbi:MAG: cupin domain-containing protein [Candidatus Omnitrophica bacterium]|nr:cupin domain-containing protein [Candidatus Omnitrophota bacterium]